MIQIKQFFSLPTLSVLLVAMVLGLSSCASSGTSKSTGEALDDGCAHYESPMPQIARDLSVGNALEVEVETFRGWCS